MKPIIDTITAPSAEIRAAAQARIDSLAKPLGSLGRLESIAAQVAAISGTITPAPRRKCTIVMSADHGIVEEGIACAPQEVTAIQTINMLKNLTGICVLSNANGADVRVVDIGIKPNISHPGLIARKVRPGTANFAKEAAMERHEAEQAVLTGIQVVQELAHEGYNLIGTGEMGIGNTSCSSAIFMALTGASADEAVGKGGGITDEALARKKQVISAALALHQPDPADPLDVLSKVGGLDVAGMVGCFLGAAHSKVPVVIDGFISAAAALVACRLNPLVREYLIPSHRSAEPGYVRIMAELQLEPLLHLDMRLGEGTGCPLAFGIVDAALSMLSTMATFDEAMINRDYLVDIRP
ncbi:nicotinate-nucleotide--dimethylbenzimidazole phosphoribosyltransferase [Desulfurispirillum indicum]|uniref:Nicotinate-nucleotide--dimethylbenzimidazole phosphoribosyltransferase n=1 Tax=Desulfurispirillum indicum (strain ATCC BAA-1389 / DSM 22839 / S5) TaxID=653733 RepID=E6W0R4_DESIS|nr:nicotinate-nucleotide--dimethylbenzimidazole phosphoribosyltransferase [Desulfurispirillum indicum]ADU66409.1 nicotinate-nucleotide/dimethylbenzimidazole phosphoribosyltransferase [Desulfurispirillum indicum S5]UCZ58012.1 nicotinate-nucleotide--dimethylbenzimidazole phosphoribosyltransferase [Desulfurispirillum indicum]